MGFMSAMGKAFKAPLKAPGMGAITKPAGKVLGAVPGVRGVMNNVPGLGGALPPRQGPPPIGPSPNMQVPGNVPMGPPPQAIGPPQGPPPGMNIADRPMQPPGMMMADRQPPGMMMQDRIAQNPEIANAPPNWDEIAARSAQAAQQNRPMGPSPQMMGNMGMAQGPMRRIQRGPMQ